MNTSEKEESIDFCNSEDKEILLWIEPWCLEIFIAKKDIYTIVGIGPSYGRFLVEYSYDKITVYGWSGSTIKVIKNHSEIVFDDLLRVPPVPGSKE
jgi:hypothetical protein